MRTPPQEILRAEVPGRRVEIIAAWAPRQPSSTRPRASRTGSPPARLVFGSSRVADLEPYGLTVRAERLDAPPVSDRIDDSQTLPAGDSEVVVA